MAISLRLGWQKDHLHPAGSGDPSATPNSVIFPHRSPDSGCFALLLPGYAVALFISQFSTVHIMESVQLLIFLCNCVS